MEKIRFLRTAPVKTALRDSMRLVVNVCLDVCPVHLKGARNVPLTETSAANVRETMLLSMASAHSIIVPSLTSVASARLLVARNAKKRLLSLETHANVRMGIT